MKEAVQIINVGVCVCKVRSSRPVMWKARRYKKCAIEEKLDEDHAHCLAVAAMALPLLSRCIVYICICV